MDSTRVRRLFLLLNMQAPGKTQDKRERWRVQERGNIRTRVRARA